MAANIKNITNGELDLTVDEEDKVNEHYKFIRVPGGDIFESVRRRNNAQLTNYYIENIRTGSFSQISETYMLESHQTQNKQEAYTTNSFDAEMHVLRTSLGDKLQKATTFFQGIFAGMALLFTITLNLSESVSRDLVRVEDQAIRVISVLSALGALYGMLRAKQSYQFVKIRGTSAQVDQKYKCFVLCVIEMILYFLSYLVFNISHSYSVSFNISGIDYNRLSTLTTIYTVVAVLGWIVTNVNSYKHEL